MAQGVWHVLVQRFLTEIPAVASWLSIILSLDQKQRFVRLACSE
jgi:hypothetical protein